MTARPIGIIFNGATGELAARQHLPALAAMRDEGGLPLADGARLVPDVVLVGRDPGKLEAVAARTGFRRMTTDLDAALASATETVFFDAAPTGLRVSAVHRAIAAGKHVYCEKPIAGSAADALMLHTAANAAGVKAGTVQDKLFLPGFEALLGLRRAGFFGRVLEVRVEMGRWIFDGFDQPGQRPSWNYRKRDGGGLILDMFPHWRYMIDALAGEVRAVSAVCRTQIPRRRNEQGDAYDVDVEDSVFAQFELEGGAIASVNSSWCTRARREFPIQVQIDGALGSAVAGPFACWKQDAAAAPGGAISAALPQAASFFDGWTAVPVNPAPVNSYRAGWELFLRHVAEDAPFPYSLLQGVKGVQLAECAYQSSRERRWVDVPVIAA
ncbi:MAG: Gfo/Idh/MocA family oxidoreductase [Acetobacteraceae bacterium]